MGLDLEPDLDPEPPLGERTCVVCRRKLAREDGIRLLRADDGVPSIDWKGRGGSRGAWVCWTAKCLRGVCAPGRLERAWKAPVVRPTPSWPLDEIKAGVGRRQREFVGLAARVGQLRCGGNAVNRAVSSGWAVGVGLATDAGATVAADLRRRGHGLQVEVIESMLDSEGLGQALGKDGPRSAVAIGRGPLGTTVLALLRRGREAL